MALIKRVTSHIGLSRSTRTSCTSEAHRPFLTLSLSFSVFFSLCLCRLLLRTRALSLLTAHSLCDVQRRFFRLPLPRRAHEKVWTVHGGGNRYPEAAERGMNTFFYICISLSLLLFLCLSLSLSYPLFQFFPLSLYVCLYIRVFICVLVIDVCVYIYRHANIFETFEGKRSSLKRFFLCV